MNKKLLVEQYNIEHEGHLSIMSEPSSEKRKALYKKAYDDIYAFFKEKRVDKKSFGVVKNSYRLYTTYMKDKIVVDYGCGYGNFSNCIALNAKFVHGVDASESVIKSNVSNNKNQNILYHCQQSMLLPFESGSIDVFYSTGVIEHLHPDDAIIHLKEVYRCLKKEGLYIFIMPNRIFGPSDVSKFFLKRGSVAQGLHLKEYTYKETYALLDSLGYSSVKTPLFLEHLLVISHSSWLFNYILTDSRYKIRLEKMLSKFPKIIPEIFRVRGVSMVARK